MPKHGRTVASVYCKFNIQSTDNVADGPITTGEQVAAIERFVRWHERQVALGRELLAKVQREAVAPKPVADETVTSA